MSAELSFWSSLFLLLLLCLNYVRHERLKAQVTQVLEHDKEVSTITASLLPILDSKNEESSLQADTNVHHQWELIRLRESMLELAYDLRRLSELQYVTTHATFPTAKAREVIELLFGKTQDDQPIWAGTLGLSNRVLARHTQLPPELPREIKEQYQAGNWTCPQCDTEIEHCWSGWCSTCQRRTAPFERTPAELDTVSIEHEQTTPGLEWHEEFTCFHCHQVFLLTQHPLAAVCPHCGVRQIDVAI